MEESRLECARGFSQSAPPEGEELAPTERSSRGDGRRRSDGYARRCGWHGSDGEEESVADQYV